MDRPIELLRVVRQPSGQLQVEVGRKLFATLADIGNAKARAMVLAAVSELLDFAGGYEALVEAGLAPALATSAVEPPAPTRPVETVQTPEVVEPSAPTLPAGINEPSEPVEAEDALAQRQEAFLASLRRAKEATGEPSTPANSPSFFGRLRRRDKQSAAPPPSLDLIGDLNQILQRHLDSNPELRSQIIQMEENPRGGLRINVNGRYFEDVAEIDDPLIRLLIKTATKEWESSR